MITSSWQPNRFTACLVVASVYMIGAKLGFAFAFETQQVTAIWPPSGIALAAFILRGSVIWPGVFVGAFLCNLAIDVPAGAALAIAAGNTIGPYAGSKILLQDRAFTRGISGLKDVLALAVISMLSMTITSTNGVVVLTTAGVLHNDHILSVWALWWVGDAMGAIVVAPLLLAWCSVRRHQLPEDLVPELTFCLCTVVAVSYLCFTSALPLAYPVFPIVAWIAVRFQQRFATFAVALTSAIAVWQTARGNGPFVFDTPDYHLGMLVCFMAVLSLTALTLAVMADERASAEEALRTTNHDLEAIVSRRTQELTRAYVDLRQSEESFRGAFETSAHGMAIVSPDGQWLRVNKALCEIVGYTEAELLRTDFQSITHPDDLDLDISFVEKLLDGAQNTYQLEKRYFHKHGHVVWIALSVSIVRTVDGRPLHFVSQVVDITRQKTHSAALKEAKEKADSANRAKNLFLANMSHELRTPMTGIIGFADLLLDTRLTSSQTNYVTLLKNASLSLLAIIDDILDLTKVEAGRIELNKAPFCPDDIVWETVELFKASAEGRGLGFETWVDPLVSPLVLGDPKRLRQCLANLVSNASKYTHQGRINIRVSNNGADTIRFSITDTGAGIAEADLPLLFQNFSRLATDRVHGTGLGLAITKKLVEEMGGEIGVESAVGHGSTFWFALPLPAVAISAHPEPACSPPNSVRNILVVEDIELNQIIIRAILVKAGHLVTVVSSGECALTALREKQFDIVLMDVQLPGMSGLETTQRIRASLGGYSDIPILALSANAMTEEIEACVSAGMNGHIAKPIDRIAMLSKIGDVQPRATAA